MDNAFSTLGEVVVRSFDSDRTNKGYRSKLASSNTGAQKEALNSAYLDGFFDYFASSVKEASMIDEYCVASDFGTQLGLELLIRFKDSVDSTKC